MAFDFEWTGKIAGNEADAARGITAANDHCSEMGYDPAQIWADAQADESGEGDAWRRWNLIEYRAVAHLAKDWHATPENVSLIWR